MTDSVNLPDNEKMISVLRNINEMSYVMGRLKDIIQTRMKTLESMNPDISNLIMATSNIENSIKEDYKDYTQVRNLAHKLYENPIYNPIEESFLQNINEKYSYWLIPAVQAIFSYLKNEENKAQAMATKAIQLNKDKANIFFSLFLNKIGKQEIAIKYLEEVFPNDRNTGNFRVINIILLDAYINGYFGAHKSQIILSKLQSYINAIAKDEKRDKIMSDNYSNVIKGIPNNNVNIFSIKKYKFNQVDLSKEIVDYDTFLHRYEDLLLRHINCNIFINKMLTVKEENSNLNTLYDIIINSSDSDELQKREGLLGNKLLIKQINDKKPDINIEDNIYKDINLLATEIFLRKFDFISCLLPKNIVDNKVKFISQNTKAILMSLSKRWLESAYKSIPYSVDNITVKKVLCYSEYLPTYHNYIYNLKNKEEIIRDMSVHIQEDLNGEKHGLYSAFALFVNKCLLWTSVLVLLFYLFCNFSTTISNRWNINITPKVVYIISAISIVLLIFYLISSYKNNKNIEELVVSYEKKEKDAKKLMTDTLAEINTMNIYYQTNIGNIYKYNLNFIENVNLSFPIQKTIKES